VATTATFNIIANLPVEPYLHIPAALSETLFLFIHLCVVYLTTLSMAFRV
jgi:hypothetical protein